MTVRILLFFVCSRTQKARARSHRCPTHGAHPPIVVSVAGYIGAFTAIIFFGTYGCFIKTGNPGNGLVFQWVESAAILICGFALQFYYAGYGEVALFEPLVVVGGVFWALGNVLAVPVIELIGLGLGVLLWGISNLAVGWSAGFFGLVVKKETPAIVWLNVVGVVVVVLSGFLYLPIKPTVDVDEKEASTSRRGETRPLLSSVNSDSVLVNEEGGTGKQTQEASLLRRLFGAGLAVLSGLFYGVNMIPLSYIQEKKSVTEPLRLAFSHFAGVFLGASVLLIGYLIFSRNRPKYDVHGTANALMAGVFWSVAQAGWFIANDQLGLSVSFPLVAGGPQVVANLWAIFYFREIRGQRNLLNLGAAFVVTLGGILMVAFSK